MIEVTEAPPYCAVQDLGREGLRAQGVPPAGAMDPESLSIGNLLVGNPPGAAGLEWALGQGRLRFTHSCRFAITGADSTVTLDGSSVPSWADLVASPGAELVLGVPRQARFTYLAIAGGVDVPEVLGSRSTYLPGKFGGLEGRLVRKGDVIPSGAAESHRVRQEALPEELRPRATGTIRILEGPQRALFTDQAWDQLLGTAFSISPTSDRMGYRLEGPALAHTAEAAFPSEPVCPGAIQVPQGSAPIVLMPDGPTVGGYPKIAVIITADLGRMAQIPPSGHPRFVPVHREEALTALQDARARVERVRTWLSSTAR